MTYYFNRIDICESYHLSKVQYCTELARVFINDFMPWEQLPSVGLISCEVTSTTEKGIKVYDIKLSAKLDKLLELGQRPFSIRLTDLQGTEYLVGISSKPFPEITLTDKFGRPGDGLGTTFAAHLRSTIPPLRILKAVRMVQ